MVASPATMPPLSLGRGPMRRRIKSGGNLPKTRRREAVTPKRASPKTVPGRNSSATSQEIDMARAFRERDQALEQLSEALEQQTASSKVLGIISASPEKLEPVFQTVLENATRICRAQFGTLFRFDGHAYHLAAQFGTPPKLAEFQRQRGPFRPPPGGHFDRLRGQSK